MISNSNANGDSDLATLMFMTDIGDEMTFRKCASDDFKMLVTLLAILVTDIIYLFT